MTQTQYILDVQSTDWLMMLDMLILAHRKSEQDMAEHMQMSIMSPDRITYAIDKDWLPAEKLAKMVGASVEQVERAPVIELRPLKGTAEWQNPTVSYYGRA